MCPVQLTEDGRLANGCPLNMAEVGTESLCVGVDQGADEQLLGPFAPTCIRGDGLVKDAAGLAVSHTTVDALDAIVFSCAEDTAR